MIKNKIPTIVLVFLILIPVSLSLGITPGRTTVDFESNLEKTISVTVLNNENKEFTASIYTKGVLADYIELSTDELIFTENDESKSFVYDVNLPNSLDPGLNKGDVIVRETNLGRDRRETSIGALVAVISQLHVNVPYPGKYLKIDLLVKEAKPGETVKFFIPAVNLGTDRIDDAKPYVFVYDPSDNKIVKIEGTGKQIYSKERTEFMLEWSADTLPGFYKAVAVIEYDENKITAESNFLVGDFFLELLDVSVEDFTLGQIARFNILVENIGNKLITDAYSELILSNDFGEVLNTKSASINIDAEERKDMYTYWDTENVGVGEYLGKLILGYEDKSAERRIRTIVEQDTIMTEIIGITALAVGAEKASPKTQRYLIPLGIILLVFANVVWIFYFKRKNDFTRQ